MKSEFLDWFVEQQKTRTSSGLPNHTDQQLRDMVQAGKVADRVLACRELWDEKQQSALYAWNARNGGEYICVKCGLRQDARPGVPGGTIDW